MRSDTDEFKEKNDSEFRRPIIVIALSFDEENTDVHYLTTQDVPDLVGNKINDSLKIVSSTSMEIYPQDAHSTIGSINFQCNDIGLSALQKSRLDAGNGLNGKQVAVYFGHQGLPWDKFVLVQTQIVSNDISFKNKVYRFKCSDVQRLARRKLFVVKETYLTASISATDTTLSVGNTTGGS